MDHHPTCQSCRRPATESLLSYRRGTTVVRNDTFLQCDICERYACADCLRVYDIFSGYDFLCLSDHFLPKYGFPEVNFVPQMLPTVPSLPHPACPVWDGRAF